MIWSLNQKKCNNKYEEVLRTAFKFSEHFSCCTFRVVHKNKQQKSFIDFFDTVKDFSADKYEFTLPVHYRSGQKFYVYELNVVTKNALLNIGSFDNWYIYNYPEDLAFYHDKKVWFRCISHEKMISLETGYEPIIKAFQNLDVGLTEDLTHYI